jgi:hypothetical protein
MRTFSIIDKSFSRSLGSIDQDIKNAKLHIDELSIKIKRLTKEKDLLRSGITPEEKSSIKRILDQFKQSERDLRLKRSNTIFQ